MNSHFASPERASWEEVVSEFDFVCTNPVLNGLLQSVGGLLAVLNQNRQILAVNDAFIKMLGINEGSKAMGLRPGEALGCVHAHKEEAGCGTSRYCSTCGAAVAIVSAIEDDVPIERICSLTASRGSEQYELALLVRAHPLHIEGHKYILLFVQDITAQEQRAALERTFFHDVNNLIAMLVHSSEFLLTHQTSPDMVKVNYQAAIRLQREVAIQRSLSTERQSMYQPFWSMVSMNAVFSELDNFFLIHSANEGKRLEFVKLDEDCELRTDLSVLQRVMTNMIVNALEATARSGKVKVWAVPNILKKTIRISVWNGQVIPPEIRLRVFQRNFSTKDGSGRGIGTYSMKLFGEEILGGRVNFTSSALDGTVFTLEHPLDNPAAGTVS